MRLCKGYERCIRVMNISTYDINATHTHTRLDKSAYGKRIYESTLVVCVCECILSDICEGKYWKIIENISYRHSYR